jgi:hypothetical protein
MRAFGGLSYNVLNICFQMRWVAGACDACMVDVCAVLQRAGSRAEGRGAAPASGSAGTSRPPPFKCCAAYTSSNRILTLELGAKS